VSDERLARGLELSTRSVHALDLGVDLAAELRHV
jgi:hypothetical protein